MTDLIQTVERLGPMADKAGELAKAQRTAFADATTSEAELLAAVVERIKPGLPAVASRIQSSHRSWWPDSVSTASEKDYLKVVGLRVDGDGEELDHPRANRGQYEGSDLYLLKDGTWLEVTYSGHWSSWQGESDEWTTETETLSHDAVAQLYHIPGIIGCISEALEKQLSGKREKATARARERAATMRALTTLLRGGKS